MARTISCTRSALALVFAWLALGMGVNACVGKPAFHCQNDESCVGTDGSHGICQASGECTFHSALDAPSGASGTGGVTSSTAGSASSADDPSAGGSGNAGSEGEVASAGEGDAAGAAGASCTDPSAGNCYRCSPQTSAQFLNACTASACVPFDDHARLTNLTPSGELPPLPPVSGQ